MKIDHFPEAIYHTFLNVSPIDKLYAGFYKGDIKKIQVANKEIVFGYSTKSNSNRLLNFLENENGEENFIISFWHFFGLSV
jgi:hypothetical protein